MNKPTRPRRADAALPLLKPVENITLREQVTQAVRTALMHGHLQPGQPITVKSIATMVGASVMPAREAMNRLIAEGALELRPNRSVIVPAMSRQEFDELTDLRCHIEAQAAAHAVERVTPADIVRLKALDEAMHAAVPGADVETYLSRNFEFHFHIYQLGTSKFFLSIIEKLWVRVGPLIRFSLNESGFGHSIRLHACVIRGLETQDSPLLRNAIQADITGAAQSIRAARDAAKAWY
jgi:DNA-binding GntR family transcriptional regulator